MENSLEVLWNFPKTAEKFPEKVLQFKKKNSGEVPVEISGANNDSF